jgi:predicted flap endonuclease-1-like 5' DNA nuclease
MTPHLIEIVLLMLAFFLLGCLIGYYVRRWTTASDTSAEPAPNVTPSRRDSEEGDTKADATSSTTAAKKADAESVAETAKAASASNPAAKKPAAKAPAKKTTPRNAPTKATSKPADDKPELLSAPRDGKKDDLKKIKGVGPKIEGILNEKGIYHYDQVAAWKRKDVKWFDEELSFKGRIDREEWVKQAKALAKAKS